MLLAASTISSQKLMVASLFLDKGVRLFRLIVIQLTLSSSLSSGFGLPVTGGTTATMLMYVPSPNLSPAFSED